MPVGTVLALMGAGTGFLHASGQCLASQPCCIRPTRLATDFDLVVRGSAKLYGNGLETLSDYVRLSKKETSPGS